MMRLEPGIEEKFADMQYQIQQPDLTATQRQEIVSTYTLLLTQLTRDGFPQANHYAQWLVQNELVQYK